MWKVDRYSPFAPSDSNCLNVKLPMERSSNSKAASENRERLLNRPGFRRRGSALVRGKASQVHGLLFVVTLAFVVYFGISLLS